MRNAHRPTLRLLLLFTMLLLPSIHPPDAKAAVGAVRERPAGPIALHYSFAAPQVEQVGEVHSVTIPGLSKLERPGSPRLPIQAARILVPFGQRVSGIEVICDTRVELSGTYQVEHGQKQVPLGRTGPVSPTLPSPDIYGSRTPFPERLHSSPSLHWRKGYQILTLTLYPVQVVPQKGSLSYCASMTVQVSTQPATQGGYGMLRRQARHWSIDREETRAISKNAEAAESYPGAAELASQALSAEPSLDPSTLYDYVMITNEDLMNAPGPHNFQAMAAAKEARGISTVITTTEWISATYGGLRPDGGHDLQTKIREFITDAYQTWGTEYVLLGGDSDGEDVGGESGDTIVPHRGFFVAAGPDTDFDIPADMYYACLDGTFDYDGDGIYAEPTDGPDGGEVDLYAEVVVGRAAIDSPDELSNFVAKTLAYEGENHSYLRNAWMVGEDLGWTARWGGDRKDDVLNGSDAAGYTTVGFEDSSSATFLDTQTLYDRDHAVHNWPQSEIVDVINSPAHLINHLGHADVTSVMKLTNSAVDGSLTNDRYFIGYSQGCYAGAFDNRDAPLPYGTGGYLSSDSISEHLAAGPHGAVAFVSNSRYGWGDSTNPHLGASQYYDRQFWDAVLGENILNVGRANQDSKEDTYGVVGPGGFDAVMRWVCYELNVFGDPELMIKTGADSVTVQSHTIDDDDSGGSSGNGNGRVDVGETIEMDVTLFNVRQTEVTNVTAQLSTADAFTTIHQDVASFGDIAAAGYATSITPYVFSTNPGCPDEHWITFDVDITGTVDAGGTVEMWSDSFQVEIHSKPQIEISPSSFTETLDWAGTAARTLTISNRGPAALEFELFEAEMVDSLAGRPLGNVGPDSFGYVVHDSEEPDGPAFDFVDISASGTPVAMGDDASAGPFDIGFTFPFYGADETQFYVSSNGFLSFGRGSAAMFNQCPLPKGYPPQNLIALMWDDLDPGDTGDLVYYQTFPSCPYGTGSCLVVQYEDYHHYPGGGGIAGTFEAVLFDSGNVLVQLLDAGAEAGAESTTGIENADGSDGLTYGSCNVSGSLGDELAICFQYPGAPPCGGSSDVPWLSEHPTEGTVPASGAVPVTLTLDGSQVDQPGTYRASLRIASNDPDHPIVTAPVTMTVRPATSMGQLEGTVTSDRPGGPLSGALVEAMSGTTCVISGTTDASGRYGPWWLGAGSYGVRISAAGYFTDTQAATITAEQTTSHDVMLAADAPEANVTPASIEEALRWGERITRTLSVRNSGTLPLSFDLYESAGGFSPLLGGRGDPAPPQSPIPLLADIPTVQVIQSTPDELVLDAYIAGLATEEVLEGGTVYRRLRLPHSGTTTEIGLPELPAFGRFLALPQGAHVEIEVLDAASETIEDVLIYPAQPPKADGPHPGDEPPLYIDEDFYARDALYPGAVATADTTKILRGCPVTVLRLYPYQVNPATQELTMYSRLRLRVRLVGGEGSFVEPRYRAPSFENLYRRLFLNYAQLGTAQKPSTVAGPSGAEFLIITHPDFLSAANALAAWRNASGLVTQVLSTDDVGSTASEIRAAIQDAYDTWSPPPEFVLFLGDAEFVPTNYQTVHPAQGTLIGTDLYYATVDGSDYYPDIHTGRISVDTAAEAERAIDAIIDYERDPVADESFYQTVALAAYFQDDDHDGYEDRRFVLTSEEIHDHLKAQGYNVERIYRADPTANPTHYNDDLYADGEPLPPALLHSNGFAWAGDSDDVTSALNSGCFILNHRDHGYTSGWGDPAYEVSHVQALANGNRLPVVFSINCQTGWFDNETDAPADDTGYTSIHFAEAWQRNPNGGAVGVIGTTRISYSGYNDWMTEGFYDAIWPDFLAHNDAGFSVPEYRMGAVLTYGKLAVETLWGDASGYQQAEFEMFHYFGDPVMEIHTASPTGGNVAWLDEDPTSGTVGVGGVQSVQVMLDAGAVDQPGLYTAQLQVHSDDPYNETIYVPVTMTVASTPVLDVAKSASPAWAQADAPLTYTIVVRNTGDMAATALSISDTIPAHTTFAWVDPGGVLTGDQVQWTGHTLNVGESLTVSLGVTVSSPLPPGTDIVNADYVVSCAEGARSSGSPVTTPVGKAVYLPLLLR